MSHPLGVVQTTDGLLREGQVPLDARIRLLLSDARFAKRKRRAHKVAQHRGYAIAQLLQG